MKISVIITLYNPENIDLLIKGIVNMQLTCKNKNLEFEYIFVDDYSENLLKWQIKIEKFLQKFPGKFLKLGHKKEGINRVTVARNLGIKYSEGDYVFFIDQDIIFHSKYCSILEKILQKFPNSIICGSFLGYNNIFKKISSIIIEDYIRRGNIFGKDFQDFRGGKIFKKDVWEVACASHLIIPKNIFLKGIYFDENILSWGGEDIDFAYRLSKESIDFIYIPQLYLLNLSEKLYEKPFSIFTEENYSGLVTSFLYLAKKYQSDQFFLNYIDKRLYFFPENTKQKFLKEIEILKNYTLGNKYEI